MGKDLNRNEFVATATWNAATTNLANNASASATSGSVWIPEGALITKAYYHVKTTFADGGDDSQTLALGYTGATGAFVRAVSTFCMKSLNVV